MGGQEPLVWSRHAERAGQFAERYAARTGLDVSAVPEPAHAAASSQIVVTLTPATRGYLGPADVRPGTFVAAVGSDAPDKQELLPSLLASAAVVVDVRHQAAAVGELHHAIRAGLLTERDVRAELGEVVTGSRPGRLDDQEVIVFDSTGTAIQDVAAAQALYQAARRNGAGQPLPLWR